MSQFGDEWTGPKNHDFSGGTSNNYDSTRKSGIGNNGDDYDFNHNPNFYGSTSRRRQTPTDYPIRTPGYHTAGATSNTAGATKDQPFHTRSDPSQPTSQTGRGLSDPGPYPGLERHAISREAGSPLGNSGSNHDQKFAVVRGEKAKTTQNHREDAEHIQPHGAGASNVNLDADHTGLQTANGRGRMPLVKTGNISPSVSRLPERQSPQRTPNHREDHSGGTSGNLFPGHGTSQRATDQISVAQQDFREKGTPLLLSHNQQRFDSDNYPETSSSSLTGSARGTTSLSSQQHHPTSWEYFSTRSLDEPSDLFTDSRTSYNTFRLDLKSPTSNAMMTKRRFPSSSSETHIQEQPRNLFVKNDAGHYTLNPAYKDHSVQDQLSVQIPNSRHQGADLIPTDQGLLQIASGKTKTIHGTDTLNRISSITFTGPPSRTRKLASLLSGKEPGASGKKHTISAAKKFGMGLAAFSAFTVGGWLNSLLCDVVNQAIWPEYYRKENTTAVFQKLFASFQNHTTSSINTRLEFLESSVNQSISGFKDLTDAILFLRKGQERLDSNLHDIIVFQKATKEQNDELVAQIEKQRAAFHQFNSSVNHLVLTLEEIRIIQQHQLSHIQLLQAKIRTESKLGSYGQRNQHIDQSAVMETLQRLIDNPNKPVTVQDYEKIQEFTNKMNAILLMHQQQAIGVGLLRHQAQVSDEERKNLNGNLQHAFDVAVQRAQFTRPDGTTLHVANN